MFGLIVALACVWHLAQAAETASDYGISVTTGPIPGYVKDDVCATCHGDISKSFEGLGMGRSFYRPSQEKVIEDFSLPPFYHPPSDRYYTMQLVDGAYRFARWREAPDGTRMDVFEQQVDWIVGSGNHSRVYLYRSTVGTMYQLPLAWYSQSRSWGMAPGFEFANHLGVGRLVRHRCMTCHNAYPDMSGMPTHDLDLQVFPEDLPEGIGCQRCHGPGAEHVGLALDREVLGDLSLDQVRSAIVNPDRLSTDRARDVCYSCHLQPSVALPAILRPGRSAYDFRPGEQLSNHVLQIDIDDALRATSERFEINHHPYRMEQSPCFVESGGAFGCTTCHDPHAKASASERADTVRTVCLSCHETTAGLPVLASGQHPDIAADVDCATCHMPKRRPQDVTQLWVTDHRIQVGNAPSLPPPPLDKIAAEVVGVSPYRLPDDVPDWEKTLAQALSILSYSGYTADYAADAVGRILASEEPKHIAPWLAFAETALNLDVPELAFRAAQHARTIAPDHPIPVKFMGLAKLKQGDAESARLLTEVSLSISATMAEQNLNLALILLTIGDLDAALAEARLAVEKSHSMWQAWRLIGEIEMRRGDLDAAAEALQRALEIDPGTPDVRKDLVSVLQDLGRIAEADRHAAMLERDMLAAE